MRQSWQSSPTFEFALSTATRQLCKWLVPTPMKTGKTWWFQSQQLSFAGSMQRRQSCDRGATLLTLLRLYNRVGHVWDNGHTASSFATKSTRSAHG
ncbi:hypothetical protein PF005_g31933 [Phytophthora fragariae]|uniref:Uncharacterized protein n=1 Tax=Phytophthora fragariae TaxID=53985 RepID=A0A6A3PH64_9STRA|nr:hypothetical protein PF003_g20977 [Phytophthora fragariae]KAE8956972.1 hypothetical protein PF011_g31299 [Phytophthora fragariae]KAE9060410.1 hypothetical protein PF007_g30622 [Phytophthora fragariae]KAE9062775.1 hypothetical protein PF006_g31094 [Phytophthora fragariae]KAE9159717.1 hypothetical protein PF005_g31933 [Phytophthora fragariae]